MPTPLPQVLAAVPSLNRESEPFGYHVDGGTVVGTWDIVKATSLYPTEVRHVDKDYRIVITFDTEKGTYDFTERSSESSGRVDGDGASFSKDVFVGKGTKKEFSFSFGGVNKTDEGVGLDPVVYSFETSRIKEPLFTFLEQHGWERKKGLLGKLFGR